MTTENKNAVTDEQYSGMVFEEGGDLVVNLQDVQEMKFENVPKGTYPAEIEEVVYGMGKESGKPMLTVTYKITEGEWAGKTLRNYLSFSQGALPGTKANIARIAPELANQPFKPKELADQGYFLGKTCRIRVDLKEYQGEKRSNIVGILAASTGEGDGFLKG